MNYSINIISKKDYFFIFLFNISVLFSMLLFGSLGMLEYYNYFFLIFIIILYIVNRKAILILYLFILIASSLLPSSYNIFNYLGMDEIISITTIIMFYNYSSKNKSSNYYQNIGIQLIFSIVLILIYTDFKNAYFNIYGLEYSLAIKRIFNYFLLYYPLILIIKNINDANIRKKVLNSIYVLPVVLFLSQIFNQIFVNVGLLAIDQTEYVGLAKGVTSVTRASGIYDGDPNSAATFFVMIVGFLFYKSEKSENNLFNYVIILVSLLGILYTGSRTGILSFLFIYLFYLYRNKANLKTYLMALLFLLSLSFFYEFILNQLSRFWDAKRQLDITETTNRVGKWIHYLSFMSQNESFIIGSSREINDRSAHNIYIQTLFNAGAVFLFNYIINFFKLIKNSFMKINNGMIYIIIPYAFLTMTVGVFKELTFFLVLLNVINYDIQTNRLKLSI